MLASTCLSDQAGNILAIEVTRRHKTTARIEKGDMVTRKLRSVLSRTILLLATLGLLGGMTWLVRGQVALDSLVPLSESAQAIPVRLYTIRSLHHDSERTLSGVVQARYETELAFRVGDTLIVESKCHIGHGRLGIISEHTIISIA